MADLIRKRRRNQPRSAADTLENWSPVHQKDRLPWLANCPRPLLYIAGSQDRKYRAIAESLYGKSDDCRVEILEDAGHAVHLDRPQQCAESIEQFIESNRETLWA